VCVSGKIAAVTLAYRTYGYPPLASHTCLTAPQIDYYPSRNNKITVAKIRGHANSTRKLTGQRVSVMIDKENNFYQCASRLRAKKLSSLADKAVMLLGAFVFSPLDAQDNRACHMSCTPWRRQEWSRLELELCASMAEHLTFAACRAGERIRSWDPERRSRFIE